MTTLFKLPGCSARSDVGQVLNRHGCETVADIQRFSVDELGELVGDKIAER